MTAHFIWMMRTLVHVTLVSPGNCPQVLEMLTQIPSYLLHVRVLRFLKTSKPCMLGSAGQWRYIITHRRVQRSVLAFSEASIASVETMKTIHVFTGLGIFFLFACLFFTYVCMTLSPAKLLWSLHRKQKYLSSIKLNSLHILKHFNCLD